jgi:hypothetical protein
MGIKFGGARTALALAVIASHARRGLPDGARNVNILVKDARASHPELDRQRKGRRGRQ